MALALAHTEHVDHLVLVSTGPRAAGARWLVRLGMLVSDLPLLGGRHRQPPYALKAQFDATSTFDCSRSSYTSPRTARRTGCERRTPMPEAKPYQDKLDRIARPRGRYAEPAPLTARGPRSCLITRLPFSQEMPKAAPTASGFTITKIAGHRRGLRGHRSQVAAPLVVAVLCRFVASGSHLPAPAKLLLTRLAKSLSPVCEEGLPCQPQGPRLQGEMTWKIDVSTGTRRRPPLPMP